MKTLEDYNRAIQIIGELIWEWNPYCLIDEYGPPKDEFDPEVARLCTFVPRIKTREDAAEAVSSVFSEAFEPEYFRPDSCADIGARLYDALAQAGLLAGGQDNRPMHSDDPSGGR